MANADEVTRLARALRQQLSIALSTILAEVDQLARRSPIGARSQSLESIRRAVRRLEEIYDLVFQVGSELSVHALPNERRTQSRMPVQQSVVGGVRANVHRLQLVLWVGEQLGLPGPSTATALTDRVVLRFERQPDLMAWAEWGDLDVRAGPDVEHPDRDVLHATIDVFGTAAGFEHVPGPDAGPAA